MHQPKRNKAIDADLSANLRINYFHIFRRLTHNISPIITYPLRVTLGNILKRIFLFANVEEIPLNYLKAPPRNILIYTQTNPDNANIFPLRALPLKRLIFTPESIRNLTGTSKQISTHIANLSGQNHCLLSASPLPFKNLEGL